MAKPQPETIERIGEWIREGKDQEWIAVTLDMHPATLSTWINRGKKEQPGSPYRMLWEEVARARKDRRNGGRPSKQELADDRAMLPLYTGSLNDSIKRQIVSLLRLGRSLDDAAVLSGVDRGTARKWIQRGIRDGEGSYHEFASEVKRAAAEGKDVYVKRIESLSQQNSHEPTALRATETILRTRYADWAPPMQREPRQFIEAYAQGTEEALSARGLPVVEIVDDIHQRVRRILGGAAEPASEAEPVGALPVGNG